MNFPTELKNKIHVPNHQPAMEMEIELPSGKLTKRTGKSPSFNK